MVARPLRALLALLAVAAAAGARDAPGAAEGGLRRLHTDTWGPPTPPLPSYPCKTELPNTRSFRQVWVDPSATGSGRGTRAAPYASFRTAWASLPRGRLLTRGVVINVLPGIARAADDEEGLWMEQVWGTPAAPVVVRRASAPGRSGEADLQSINVYNCTHLYFQGLTFRQRAGSSGGGDVVHFAYCDYIWLLGIKAIGLSNGDGPQETIKVNQVKGMYIEDSEAANAGDNAIDFVAVQYGHVVRSHIHHANWCFYAKGGSAYLIIDSNTINDCNESGLRVGQGTGFEYMVAPWIRYEGYAISLTNNVVHTVYGAGLGVSGGYDIMMAYNTLYNSGQRSHMVEFLFGGHSCDGDTSPTARGQCAANRARGGWGPASPADGAIPIPNKNVYFINNLLVNPPDSPAAYVHFETHVAPTDEHPGRMPGMPNPKLADGLVIAGNVVLDRADLGLAACAAGGIASCTIEQVLRDNTFNPASVAPGSLFADSDTLAISPAAKAALRAAWRRVDPLPAVPQLDALTPPGQLVTAVPLDASGAPRTADNNLPGARVAALLDRLSLLSHEVDCKLYAHGLCGAGPSPQPAFCGGSAGSGGSSSRMADLVLHLLRHGVTEMNVHLSTHRYGSRGFRDPLLYDTRLTEDGKRDARSAAAAVARLQPAPELLVVSPLTRALQTAELAFGDQLPRRTLVEPLWRERLYLSSDVGRPVRALREEFPQFSFDHLPDTPWWHTEAPHDALAVHEEPDALFEHRMRRLADWLRGRPERCIAVVSHWACLHALTGHSFGNCELRTRAAAMGREDDEQRRCRPSSAVLRLGLTPQMDVWLRFADAGLERCYRRWAALEAITQHDRARLAIMAAVHTAWALAAASYRHCPAIMLAAYGVLAAELAALTLLPRAAYAARWRWPLAVLCRLLLAVMSSCWTEQCLLNAAGPITTTAQFVRCHAATRARRARARARRAAAHAARAVSRCPTPPSLPARPAACQVPGMCCQVLPELVWSLTYTLPDGRAMVALAAGTLALHAAVAAPSMCASLHGVHGAYAAPRLAPLLARLAHGGGAGAGPAPAAGPAALVRRRHVCGRAMPRAGRGRAARLGVRPARDRWGRAAERGAAAVDLVLGHRAPPAPALPGSAHHVDWRGVAVLAPDSAEPHDAARAGWREVAVPARQAAVTAAQHWVALGRTVWLSWGAVLLAACWALLLGEL
ncbi:SPAC5H10.03 [Scenedesmus sp. PABB004]|nr:SPAC5H10.03 [Scenedesmus sp. PABB004]